MRHKLKTGTEERSVEKAFLQPAGNLGGRTSSTTRKGVGLRQPQAKEGFPAMRLIDTLSGQTQLEISTGSTQYAGQ